MKLFVQAKRVFNLILFNFWVVSFTKFVACLVLRNLIQKIKCFVSLVANIILSDCVNCTQGCADVKCRRKERWMQFATILLETYCTKQEQMDLRQHIYSILWSSCSRQTRSDASSKFKRTLCTCCKILVETTLTTCSAVPSPFPKPNCGWKGCCLPVHHLTQFWLGLCQIETVLGRRYLRDNKCLKHLQFIFRISFVVKDNIHSVGI